nr:MAG TPA: hypothetical protein [Caudoviricetes sp.]
MDTETAQQFVESKSSLRKRRSSSRVSTTKPKIKGRKTCSLQVSCM